jgi:NADH dehydrogenase
VGRLHLGGFLGWWAWLVIHIGFMTGFRNRFGALLSWWFAFTRDLRRERTFTSTEVGAGRDVYAVGAAGARPEPAGAAGGAAKPGPAPGPDQRRPA